MARLHVYRSNRTEDLTESLLDVLEAQRPAPFETVEIVVGRRGMDRWLTQKIAERFGVCANVKFPFPAGQIDKIVARVLGEWIDQKDAPPDPWAPESLTWTLLEVLPKLTKQSGFDELRGYADWSAPVDAKQYGLAVQLANMFDRYVAYRPEIARAWSDGKKTGLSDGDKTLGWQYELWQAVRQRIGEHHHRAERIHRAQQALEKRTAAAPIDFPLRIFGVSSLPPSWMGLLGALSAVTDVDLFLLCPSNEYWADLGRKVHGSEVHWLDCDRDGDEIRGLGSDLGNPLLISMGRLARDFQIVLESQPDGYEDLRTDLFRDPWQGTSPCALHCIQSDVLAARHPTARTLDPHDDSFQFHSCYGPTRQVEVLRDLLLGLLDDHPDLEPRDIIVLTPDIEKYEPLITAVFEQGREEPPWGPVGAPRIPVRVADLTIRRLNPVADALVRILEMADGRLEASSVIDLVTLDPVREKFGIAAEQIATIEKWVAESGIRWGRDAGHRTREGQPDDDQNTWRFGLRRLLLGVVMADDDKLLETDRGDVLPFDAMEGGETVLLGRFVDFVSTLFAAIDRLRDPRPLSAWIDALDAVLDECTVPPKGMTWLGRQVRDGLRTIEREGGSATSKRNLTLEAIRSTLAGHFEVPNKRANDRFGGVTFCALQPMRSVPYAVVCLLGMDDGAFPRKAEGLAFDLVRRHSRIGDRSPRDEDRFLILEALLAARRHLVVLYSGRDPHNNEQRPPCVPVGELRDVVDLTFPKPQTKTPSSDLLTAGHPLQAFSPKAFSAPRPWSFDRRLMEGADAWRNKRDTRSPFFSKVEPAEVAPGALEEIPIQRLIRFFKSPTEYLVKTRLGIDLTDEKSEIPDREPIELDALEEWKLHRALLVDRSRERNPGTAGALRRARAGGALALGYAGMALVARETALVDAMLEKTEGLRSGPHDPVKIDLTVGRVRVTGQISDGYGEQLVQFQFASKEKAKHLAEIWIPLVACRAMPQRPGKRPFGRGVLVLGDWDKAKGTPIVQLKRYEAPDDAARLFAELVSIYLRGIHEPIPLFQLSSWELAQAICAGDAVKDPRRFAAKELYDPCEIALLRGALANALKIWSGNGNDRAPADLKDRHVARVFEGQNPLFDPNDDTVPNRDFVRLALTLWGDLCVRRTTLEPDDEETPE